MIPTEVLLRLLRNVLGDRYDGDDFLYGVQHGFVFSSPGIDEQDIATLARIASGEAWEVRPS